MCLSVSDIFSTCAKKQYAAVLIDENNHIVSVGYNGGPSGFDHCKDGGCPRLQQNSTNGSDYDNCIAIHAEANALLHSDYSAKPTKLYVNGPPCFSCAKLIVNSTVTDVYYIEDPLYLNWPTVELFLNTFHVSTHRMESASV